MKINEDLKHCPFCGYTDQLWLGADNNNDKELLEIAKNAWNKRNK